MLTCPTEKKTARRELSAERDGERDEKNSNVSINNMFHRALIEITFVVEKGRRKERKERHGGGERDNNYLIDLDWPEHPIISVLSH